MAFAELFSALWSFFLVEGGYKQSPIQPCWRPFDEEATWTSTLGNFTKKTKNSLQLCLKWTTTHDCICSFFFCHFAGENRSGKSNTDEWLWREEKNVTETSRCDSSVFWLVWQSKGTLKLSLCFYSNQSFFFFFFHFITLLQLLSSWCCSSSTVDQMLNLNSDWMVIVFERDHERTWTRV